MNEDLRYSVFGIILRTKIFGLRSSEFFHEQRSSVFSIRSKSLFGATLPPATLFEHFQCKNDVLQGAKVMLHIYLSFQYAESPVVQMESVSECAAVSKHLPQHHLVPHCIHISGHQSQVQLQPPIIGTTSITLLTMAGSLTL